MQKFEASSEFYLVKSLVFSRRFFSSAVNIIFDFVERSVIGSGVNYLVHCTEQHFSFG